MTTSNSSIGNINVTSIKNSHGESLLNVQIEYYYDLAALFTTFIIAVPSDEKDKDFQKELLRSTINVCKIKQGVMGNFLIKTLMEDFEKYSDFKVECPFKKGKLSINKMKITEKFLPTYLLQSFKFIFTGIVKVKVVNSKKLVEFYTVKIYGEIVKN